MVEKLVGALYEAGLVRDVSQDEPHSLTPDELDSYASEIAFVEAFRTSPALRFQRYRETRTVVIGSGAIYAAAVEGALLTGVARLSARPVLVSAEVAPAPGRPPGERAAESRHGDPGQRLETAPLDAADPVALRAAVTDAGLVLYAADRTDPVLLSALDRLCAELGRTFVPVTVYADEAWVGPVCAADRPAARWESLWLRLGVRAGAGGEPTGFLTGPVPGIVANHLVFRAFEHLTGVAGAGSPDASGALPGGSAVRIDLETLQTSVHGLAPHPLVRPAGGADTEPEAAQAAPTPVSAAGAAVHADELAARVAALTDTRLGVLGPVSEAHFEQFPLRVVRVPVTHPRRPDAALSVWGPAPISRTRGTPPCASGSPPTPCA